MNSKIYAKRCFLGLGFCLVTSLTFAQKTGTDYSNQQLTPSGHIRCASVEADAFSRAIHPERGEFQSFEQWIAPLVEEKKRELLEGSQRMVITIPVVVHVIHNGDAIGSGENITDAQILSQIQVMNDDFRRVAGTRGFNNDPNGADIEIEFCMAQVDPSGNTTDGINRVNLGTNSWTMNTCENTVKPSTIWDPTEYLNMWTVRFGGADAGTLGYAQFPDNSGLAGLNNIGGAANTDGVVMAYNAFGTADLDDGTFDLNATYNLGRTTTHEVGHWLGLRHIWGDSNCGGDDFCNDTPNSDNPNFGCPNGHTSCNSTDMIENYMDYTDDYCMNIFTLEQKARMLVVMDNCPRRVELKTSTKCTPPAPIIGFAVTSGGSINEATDCSYQDVTVDLNIAMAPSADATVTIVPQSGTATGNGTDYEVIPSSVVFPAGATADQQVTIRIYNDALVEADENFVLTFNVSTAGDAVAATGDLLDYDITIIDDDEAPSNSGLITILSQDFETSLAPFTTAGQNGSDLFQLGTAATSASANWAMNNSNATQFAYTNDDACDCNKNNDRLMTPTFSLAGGYNNVTLTFDHAFTNAPVETGEVRISTGGGYTTIATLTNTSTVVGGVVNTPWVSETVDLTPYIGQANVTIQFRYRDGNDWSYGMGIDNVLITGDGSAAIQTANNTALPPSNPVPGNGEVHYYDPATNNVMLTISNTSNWDYQCTEVYVDRDAAQVGADVAACWDVTAPGALAAKTFYVDPNNNTPTGTYNITLYYTEAEIAAWEAATGKPRTDLQIIKVRNNFVSTVNQSNYNSYTIEMQPATITAFGADVALTASFSSGFSGFAIGDPNPPTPILNVEYASFEGEKINGDAALKWVTASEENSDYFNVMRSANGYDFESIGEVKAIGNSTSSQSYTYLDENPFNGINYYYIEQVSLDGMTSDSKIIALDFSRGERPNIVLAPNPANEQISVFLHTKYDSDLDIQIIDAVGRSVMQINEQSVQLGDNILPIAIQDLSSGVYTLRIQQGAHIMQERFVKQ